VQNNFHNRSERRATSKYMEIIHETKNATPLVNGSAVPRGTARHTAACCGKFAAVCRSNRAQLDFSGMGPAATRGRAGFRGAHGARAPGLQPEGGLSPDQKRPPTRKKKISFNLCSGGKKSLGNQGKDNGNRRMKKAEVNEKNFR
jgi:hypothetical protein